MMKWKLYLLIGGLLVGFNLFAQETSISGTVVDEETKSPVEAVSVTLQRAGKGVIFAYALTDQNGKFSLKTTEKEDLILSVSCLGYRTVSLPAKFGSPMQISLKPDVYQLKEVQIRPGRTWKQQDTVRYDLARFASSKDVYLKDVLKKLPGIDVAENGKIQYNGKDISNFYVEGLDATGGRYNQINNNLKADAVQTAEIIENHQPIKSLKNKVYSDDVAINLKLRPEARSQWLWNMLAGAGSDGKHLNHTATVGALEFGKKRQGVYSYKTNNVGEDLSNELQELAIGGAFDRPNDKAVSQFLNLSSISSPVGKKRVLFNQTHSLSGNQIYRLKDESLLRFQLGMYHDRSTQDNGRSDLYFLNNEQVKLDEQRNYILRTDRIFGDLNYENNAEKSYTKNRFSFSGAWGNQFSSISGSSQLSQQIKTSDLNVKNYFTKLYNKNDYSLRISSFLRYNHLPAMLKIDDKRTNMNVDNAYTDNSLYWLRKRNGLSLQATLGVKGELAALTSDPQYRADNYAAYATPQLEWEKGNFFIMGSLPFQWVQYTKQKFGRMLVNPSLFVKYNFSSRWSTYAYGGYNQTVGELTNLYDQTYQTDYRNWVVNSGVMPQTKQQVYSWYLENKNVINEFFWILKMNYIRNSSNTIGDSDFKDNRLITTYRKFQNQTNLYSLNTTISKGFYHANLKTSLQLELNKTDGVRMARGVEDRYESQSLRLTPKITWAPFRFLESSYVANIYATDYKIGQETKFDPLWNVSQQLQLNLNLSAWEIALKAEHYYNDIDQSKHLNTLFADASISYKIKKWKLSFDANNLFNKKEYRYTTYSNAEQHTYWTKLRPREFMFTVQTLF